MDKSDQLDNIKLLYQALGPLKHSEVRWLSNQSEELQRRYLKSVYGPIVVAYARVQFREMLKDVNTGTKT